MQSVFYKFEFTSKAYHEALHFRGKATDISTPIRFLKKVRHTFFKSTTFCNRFPKNCFKFKSFAFHEQFYLKVLHEQFYFKVFHVRKKTKNVSIMYNGVFEYLM